MSAWFASLSGLEIAYFIIACIGTLALLIQIILMIIGAGGDADMDMDTDTDGDGRIFERTFKESAAFGRDVQYGGTVAAESRGAAKRSGKQG